MGPHPKAAAFRGVALPASPLPPGPPPASPAARGSSALIPISSSLEVTIDPAPELAPPEFPAPLPLLSHDFRADADFNPGRPPGVPAEEADGGGLTRMSARRPWLSLLSSVSPGWLASDATTAAKAAPQSAIPNVIRSPLELYPHTCFESEELLALPPLAAARRTLPRT